MKHKNVYYDYEQMAYCEEKEEVYRGRIYKVILQYPAPPDIPFEKVYELFIEQLNNTVVPVLSKMHLEDIRAQIFGDEENK